MSTEVSFVAALEIIHELNRFFLRYLHARACEGRECLGLPEELVPDIRRASAAALDRMAVIPTALFRLNLATDPPLEPSRAAPDRPLAQLRMALVLTILHSAWHMSRRRTFEARLLLRLSNEAIGRLRATPLSNIHAFAEAQNLLTCAYPSGDLTWAAIIRSTDSDVLRMMTLIALQPDAARQPPLTAATGGGGIRTAC
jgi:hypothetical protein